MKPRFLSLILLFAIIFSTSSSAAGSEPAPRPKPDPALLALHEKMGAGESAPVLEGQAQALAEPTPPITPEGENIATPVNWSKVTFQSYRDKNWEIYLADGNGSNPTRLTNNAAIDAYPRLNRGTTRIAFASHRDGDYEINTMNLSGGDLKKLTSNRSVDAMPAWSPDSSRIAFESDRDGNFEIYVMNADGSNQVRITNDPAYDETPSWSTDGSRIFWAKRSTTSPYGDIVSANPDGSDVQVFKSGLAYVLNPIVSPTGEGIAYNYDADGDGWYEIGCSTFSGDAPLYTYCPNGLVEKTQSTNADDMLGGWMPFSTGVLYSHQEYVYYKGQYYLTSSTILTEGINSPSSFISSGYDVQPDWTTSDIVPPTSSFHPLQPLTNMGTYGQTVLYVDNASDNPGGSDINYLQIQYRRGLNGPWTTLCVINYQNEAPYCYFRLDYLTDFGSDAYYFRARAIDYAGNAQAWPVSPDYDTSSLFYRWAADGSVADSRGQPVVGAIATAGVPLVRKSASANSGSISMLLASTGATEINVRHPDYGILPSITFFPTDPPVPNQFHAWFLPPKDNIIVNGNFEDTQSTAWQYSGYQGQYPYNYGNSYSGVRGATLRRELPPIAWSNIGPVTSVAYNSIAVTADSQGNQHAVWASNSKIYYTVRPAGADWSAPASIAAGYAGLVAAAVSKDDTLTLAWAQVPPGGPATRLALYMIQKPFNGNWTGVTLISNAFTGSSSFTLRSPSLAADHQGGLHMVFGDSAGVWYAAYAPQSGWTTPGLIGANGKNPQIRVGADDTIHYLWEKTTDSSTVYARRAIGGSLSQETIPTLSQYSTQPLFVIDSLGQVQVASDSGAYLCITTRSTSGVWSPCPGFGNRNLWPQLLSMDLGPDGQIYVTWRDRNIFAGTVSPHIQMAVSYVPGVWSITREIDLDANSNSPQTYYLDDEGYELYFDANGKAWSVWLSQLSGSYSILTADVTIPAAMDTNLKQSVTIPAGMKNPTLSLIYTTDTALEIMINGTIVPPTGLFNFPIRDYPDGINHAWIDMSPWAGQRVEIKFNMHSNFDYSEYFYPYVMIDEVSLGSWKPQVVLNSYIPIIGK